MNLSLVLEKNFSTSMAVLDVVNMIQKELHDDNYVLGVFMDLQKAFDTINFDISLKKLEHYGFRGPSISWLRSHLVGRSQFTVVSNNDSTTKTTTCGIPQGTILGSLLFLLYINDIPNSVNHSKIRLFADDSNLFIVSNNINTLFNVANSEVNSLFAWIDANKLFINYDKTNFMLFQPRDGKYNISQNASNLPSLKINDHFINQVHVVKYLGIYIDDKLNWHEHISYLVKKISSLTGILYRVKLFLPLQCKKQIYFALINSLLIYCVEICANVNKSVLNPLIIKCNRLLRLMQSKPKRTPVIDLYSTFGTLPVDKLFQYYTLKLIHKCIYNNSVLPASISKWFIRNSSIHNHLTRHKDFLFIQSSSNRKSIVFYGPSMWTKLPPNLQADPSLISFLRSYKEYLYYHA